MLKRIFKLILRLIFPFTLPVSKRIFDFWVKVLEDGSKAAFLAAGPYLWIGGGDFKIRIWNTIALLVVGYLAHIAVYFLDKKEAQIVRQEKKGN
ncbi:hypothetical protein PL75_10015 [Neisseria arctica]|uniref:Uncharacterized protein n=1 Tax=Neisseria arctica TaxID=1470200 RepID=A0A0J0YPK8_9NEIS|nr:hypothetical protein [Neisseria arctica]KLT72072.1 hypothetical protein PL75_10015 [Neisseria arctica]UOO85685.1 hypothetical protein LVJ86_05435 [Neisseria arctica]